MYDYRIYMKEQFTDIRQTRLAKISYPLSSRAAEGLRNGITALYNFHLSWIGRGLYTELLYSQG